jgi:hypothetical protein
MDTLGQEFTFETVSDAARIEEFCTQAGCFEAQKKTENTGEIRRKWNGSSLAQVHDSANKG